MPNLWMLKVIIPTIKIDLSRTNTKNSNNILYISGFYHKLVTRGDEVLKPVELEPHPEEAEQEEIFSPRIDIKRRSSRRIRRTHSSRKSKGFNPQPHFL